MSLSLSPSHPKLLTPLLFIVPTHASAIHRYRQSQAPELFLGAFLPGPGDARELVGYVCSTLAATPTLTHASMAAHVPGGRTVCVHSVCVARAHRRRGRGRELVRAYVAHVARRAQDAYDRVCLIAHEELVGFYQSTGFTLVGPSAVTHGARPWFEMYVDLAAPAAVPAPAQADILAALQSQARAPRPAAQLLAAFPGGVADLTSDGKNAHDLLCPRDGCGSVILKARGAAPAEGPSVALDPPAGARPACLGALPEPPAQMQWWLVKGSAMAFENISFSRPVGQTGERAASASTVLRSC